MDKSSRIYEPNGKGSFKVSSEYATNVRKSNAQPNPMIKGITIVPPRNKK